MFFPASDCPWHTRKRISTHLTACICVCAVDEICICVCVCVYVCVAFPQDKQCHPTLLWMQWVNWHWLHSVHTFTNKADQKLHLWINIHVQDDAGASEFLGQDGYVWPESLHTESTVGKEGAETHGTANTWAVTAATASGTVGLCRQAEIMNCCKSPLGCRGCCWQFTGELEIWILILCIIKWSIGCLGNTGTLMAGLGET